LPLFATVNSTSIAVRTQSLQRRFELSEYSQVTKLKKKAVADLRVGVGRGPAFPIDWMHLETSGNFAPKCMIFA